MKKWWRWLGSAVLLGLVACKVDWDRVGAAFGRMYWPLWLAALGMLLAAQVLSSLRWRMMARALGFAGAPIRYVRDYSVGMFFNLVLPTSVGGDVVRAWSLARHGDPVPPAGRRTAAAASVLADRVSGVLLLIALACAATALCPAPLPSWITWAVALLGAGALGGLACLPLIRRLLAMETLAKRFTRPRRLLEAMLSLAARPGLVAATAVLSVAVQVANVVLAWFLGVGLDLPIPPLYYAVFVPLVALLTLLPISLNGMGLREAGTVVLLGPLGIPAADALTLSLLMFAVYTAAGACGGLALLTGGPRPPLAGSVEEAEDAEPTPPQAKAA